MKHGLVEARAYRQNDTFAAALQFAGSEGIIPAPEPAHAIRAVIDEAQAAREAGEERVILFGLCGHGNFDMAAYDAYLVGDARGPGVQRGRARRGAGPAAPGRPGARLTAVAVAATCARGAAARPSRSRPGR